LFQSPKVGGTLLNRSLLLKGARGIFCLVEAKPQSPKVDGTLLDRSPLLKRARGMFCLFEAKSQSHKVSEYMGY
jgi:hypothetical protein